MDTTEVWYGCIQRSFEETDCVSLGFEACHATPPSFGTTATPCFDPVAAADAGCHGVTCKRDDHTLSVS